MPFDTPPPALPVSDTASALVPVQAQQWSGARVQTLDCQVAAEVPVALVFNGVSHAVMMATPEDLHAFALGFALSEGIIDSAQDCRDVEVQAQGVDTPHVRYSVQMEIAPRQFERLKALKRSLAGRTGCGLCGIDSLQALDMHPAPIPPAPWCADLDAATVLRPFEALAARQRLHAQAGSLHAAGWARPDGELADVFEDVGRHNALDKLLGYRALTGCASEPGFVVLTSRTSYELVRKAARLNVPALATISAPTALALQLAREAGMQLWAFCRPPKAMRYV